MKLVHLSASALAALSLAACSGGATDTSPSSSDDAIVGGKADARDAAVVELIAGDYSCTATFISQTVLLTAGHCVADDNDPQRIASGPFQIMTASSEAAAGSRNHISIRRANVHVHPRYDGDAAHDVAVLVLDSPYKVTPVPIQRTPIDASMFGSTVRLVGYGITKNNGGGIGQKRTVTTKLRGQQGDLLLIGNTGAQACDGDSGGPAFMNVHGVDTLIGTDDLAATNRNCKDGDLYQPVDQQTSFIDKYLK